MAYIKIPKEWEIPENQVTPESDYINRRKFIKIWDWEVPVLCCFLLQMPVRKTVHLRSS